MRKIDVINQTVQQANNQWHGLLEALSINVPNDANKHTACPACGGKDRFRFDNKEGRGTFYCNQCGSGDGLSLVQKVKRCDAASAAKMIADVLTYAPQRPSEQPPAREKASERAPIKERVLGLLASAEQGESAYMTDKGLSGYKLPILRDGTAVVTLVDIRGEIMGAQLLRPNGDKSLISGSHKKSSFAVVWSMQENPRLIVISEGFATAVTVSKLYPSLQSVLTLAALDNGNLKNVAVACRKKWPKSTIIIAADNDWHADGELDDNGKLKQNTGKISAEKAAEAVGGFVALPPCNEKADWDDYRQKHTLLKTLEAFEPTLIASGAKTDPKPEPVQPEQEPIEPTERPDDPLQPWADLRDDGVYWITPKLDRNGSISYSDAWLCSPVSVLGIGFDDYEEYMIMRWKPASGGVTRTEAIPMSIIGEREGWRSLKSGGLKVTTKNGLRANLADWWQCTPTKERWRVSDKTGWQYGAYILPSGEVIGTPEIPVIFGGRSAAAKGYKVAGTSQSWRETVARLANGNPSMMTAIAASLAAPVIGLVNASGFGVHFYEPSTAGKTTTQSVASSLYGEPEALKLTWYGTQLGLLNEAAAHNDGLMPLDEIGQNSDRRGVANSAYALFNGLGKLQGAKDGGNREIIRFKTLVISTGEIDLDSYVREEGKRLKAGQLVRLLNIPMTRTRTFHEHADGQSHAKAIEAAFNAHHGAAGREWIKWLAENKDTAKQAVKDAQQLWLGLLPDGAGEQVHRVAERFAILEAALMMATHITGWTEADCHNAIEHSFNAWVAEFGFANKEGEQITEAAEAFLNAFGLSRFAPHPYDPRDLPIRDLAGYRTQGKHDNDPMIFHTFPSAFENEIAKGFNEKQFAKALAEAGILQIGDRGRFKKKSIRIDGRRPEFYVLILKENE
ncbi:TOPRIM and DUF927 domain-containing protein [Xenorhabdus bovienii]|uniref:TOPRIM and DUF927 domain-containing protein n=1 Tax=Xenorhabdus bovienii TaxID=40576 RepID=UPI00237D0718|nr:TOPRIM and DUF927 domain-containing protein [Xenorhabdus bovienii]MDE1484609.1 DUF927 domain-containing protein [Xenorhabdus bovienii]